MYYNINFSRSYPRVVSYNFGKKELADILGTSYLDEFETLPGEAKKLLLAGGLHDLMNLRKSQKETLGRGELEIQFPNEDRSAKTPPVWAAHSFTGGILSTPRIKQMQRREEEFNKYLGTLPSAEADALRSKTRDLQSRALSDYLSSVAVYPRGSNMAALDSPAASPEVLEKMNKTIMRHSLPQGQSGAGSVIVPLEGDDWSTQSQNISDAITSVRNANKGFLRKNIKAIDKVSSALDRSTAKKTADQILYVGPATAPITDGASVVVYPKTAPHTAIHELSHARDVRTHGEVPFFINQAIKTYGGGMPRDEFKANRMARSYIHKFKGKVTPEQYKKMSDFLDYSDDGYGANAMVSAFKREKSVPLSEIASRINRQWAANQRYSPEENARLHIHKEGVPPPSQSVVTPLARDIYHAGIVGNLAGLGGAIYGGLTGHGAMNRVKRASIGSTIGFLGGSGLTYLGKRLYRKLTGSD